MIRWARLFVYDRRNLSLDFRNSSRRLAFHHHLAQSQVVITKGSIKTGNRRCSRTGSLGYDLRRTGSFMPRLSDASTKVRSQRWQNKVVRAERVSSNLLTQQSQLQVAIPSRLTYVAVERVHSHSRDLDQSSWRSKSAGCSARVDFCILQYSSTYAKGVLSE